MTIKRICALATLLLLVSTAAVANDGVHYTYQDQDQQVYEYWFSDRGIRVESKGSNNKTIIYRSQNDELVTLNPRSREAVILDREQIKGLIQKIKQIYRRLQQLPPAQRKMMKKAMGGMVQEIKDAEEIKKPEFVRTGSTTWNDRSAQRGVLRTDGDTAGTVLLVDDPLVSVTDGERESLEKFKDFFVEILRLSGSISESLNITDSLNQSRSLLGDVQFRMVEFQSPGTSLKLTDWGRESIPENFFDVPEDYSTRRPNFQGNAMRAGASPGTTQP